MFKKTIAIVIFLGSVLICFGQSADAQSANAKLPKPIDNFYKAFNTGDFSLFLSSAAENFTDRMFKDRLPDGGKENLVNNIKNFRAGFPDGKITVVKIWRDGNTYICKTEITGTNSGSFYGMPPTNKKVNFAAIDIFELKNGKILNVWHVEEIDKLKEQLK